MRQLNIEFIYGYQVGV